MASSAEAGGGGGGGGGSSPVLLGTRVRDADGFRGTVKYVGPVAAAKNKSESWLGVEWDKAERGKHDGSCVDEAGTLHRYFECNQRGAGSFVKTKSVTLGRSFVDALKERYVGLDAPEITRGPDDPTLPDAFVVTSKGHQKSIEFLGERKIRKWQQIGGVEKVAIRNDTVSSIGDDSVSELAGHFTEIDLQDNLLWQWSEIASLAVQIPGLNTLLLHGNRMQELSPLVTDSLPTLCFRGIKVLALNACNISSWAGIQALESFLPSIEELYLSSNSLPDLPRAIADAEFADATGVFSATVAAAVTASVESVVGPLSERGEPPPHVTGFHNLRVLDVSGCGLDEWSQVLSFGVLPSLQEILLDSNPLKEVIPAPAGMFQRLQRIAVSSSKLSKWRDIDALTTYPSFSNLRLSHIPLFAGKGASEVRPLVISRIKHLAFFNGSIVSIRERIDSEKSYLRSAIRDVEDAATAGKPLSSTDLAIMHPRYSELQALHGADLLPMGYGGSSGSTNLASDLILITFKNLSFGSNGRLEPLQKKLPSSLTILRLRLMVKQLFGLEPYLQQLSIRHYQDSVPTLMEDDQATLQYYGAADGSDIFINEAKAVGGGQGF